MIARRSSSDMADHCAISRSVRPQPTHRPRAWSMTQIFVQGVEAALVRMRGL